MIQVARRQFSDLCCKICCWHIGHVHKRIGVRHFANLLRNHVRHFITAQPDVRTPHAANSVEVFFAVFVCDVTAPPLGHDERTFSVKAREVLIRVQLVLAIPLPGLAFALVGFWFRAH